MDAVDSSGHAAALSLTAAFLEAWRQDPRAIWSSFSMIVVSEIGDKTFLIAAILAMRQSRSIVFGGAFGALALMSILSAFMGVVLPTLLPRAITTLMAALLFWVFGVKMLRDAMQMTGDEMGEEWEEAKREVEEEAELGGERHELNDMEEGQVAAAAAGTNGSAPYPPTPGMAKSPGKSTTSSVLSVAGIKEGTRNLCGLCFSPVFAHAFILTFLGEWGDRSQIATIALAAAHNIALVSFGTIAGHALCTGLAVMGGRWVATRISVKHVTLGGAIMFLLFGLLYTIESFTEARASRALLSAAKDAVVTHVSDAKQGGLPNAAAKLAAHGALDGLPGQGGLPRR